MRHISSSSRLTRRLYLLFSSLFLFLLLLYGVIPPLFFCLFLDNTSTLVVYVRLYLSFSFPFVYSARQPAIRPQKQTKKSIASHPSPCVSVAYHESKNSRVVFLDLLGYIFLTDALSIIPVPFSTIQSLKWFNQDQRIRFRPPKQSIDRAIHQFEAVSERSWLTVLQEGASALHYGAPLDWRSEVYESTKQIQQRSARQINTLKWTTEANISTDISLRYLVLVLCM